MRKAYTIEFNKLKLGANNLVFNLNDAFLSEKGSPEGYQAEITANVLIQRSENMYEITCHMHGPVTLTCDRCLDEFRMEINHTSALIIKVSEAEKYDDDEIVYITTATIGFDLSQFLFDSFMLSLPVRRVCALAGKECNKNVVQKLETPEDESTEDGDPRWDKLKDILGSN